MIDDDDDDDYDDGNSGDGSGNYDGNDQTTHSSLA